MIKIITLLNFYLITFKFFKQYFNDDLKVIL